MNMNDLYDMIYKRKSFHLFRNTGREAIPASELQEIEAAWTSFEPLYPQIRTKIRIVPAQKVNFKRDAEYCVMLYSEKKDDYLMNVGYLGEQLDLFLVSRGIGTLWFGIGRPDEPSCGGLDFVLMIAIRRIDDPSKFRKDMFKSKRKPAAEIWEGEAIDGVTDIVRFAPSACNSQPWLVKREGADLKVYRYKKPGKRGIMPAAAVSYYNRIDMGIFLCFLELCLDHENIPHTKELFTDDGSDREYTLNAVYHL
ncbi:MAG: nitroreductase [Lachnospiraceae bacterium]|nr:nitroreductase [Lachnospiraceae bacterium]